MTLPPFLLAEVRTAFRSCARPRTYAFSTLRCLNGRARNRSPKQSPTASPPQHVPSEQLRQNAQDTNQQYAENSRDIVPARQGDRYLETGRKIDVPIRVLPKEEIAPNARLSPQERLHIEHLTRHPPPQRKTISEAITTSCRPASDLVDRISRKSPGLFPRECQNRLDDIQQSLRNSDDRLFYSGLGTGVPNLRHTSVDCWS